MCVFFSLGGFSLLSRLKFVSGRVLFVSLFTFSIILDITRRNEWNELEWERSG